MRDERFGIDILIKGKMYSLETLYITIDVDKKRLWCHARLPDTGKEPISSVSFFVPITEFEKATRVLLQQAGVDTGEHIS